jgi:hypothetical protein
MKRCAVAGPGTILPTRQSIIATDRFARAVARMQLATARNAGLTSFQARREQGETRYYVDEDTYAIASRRKAGRVLWFRRHNDGEFYAYHK